MKHPESPQEGIVLECELPQAPGLVWRALTERNLLAAWLLPNDLRPEVGTRFSFEQTKFERGAIDCEVLAVEPDRILQWRQTEPGDAASGWQPVTSVVTIELTDGHGGGTHFRLIHDNFAVASPTASATVTVLNARTRSAKGPVMALARTAVGSAAGIVCQLRRAA
jgi:uncharacterized protein YndB with AHSA1/START domain